VGTGGAELLSASGFPIVRRPKLKSKLLPSTPL